MTEETAEEREKRAERILGSLKPETQEQKMERLENIMNTIRLQNIGIMNELKKITGGKR